MARGALLQRRACRYQVSVTARTVMHRTRVAERDWFWAAYLVTAHWPGFSARQLQRQPGLGRYETAWVMLQKLRRAMIRPDRNRIAGIVEVDETYLGGAEEGRAGCRWRDGRKSIVVAAVEVRGRGTGRIRLGTVSGVSGPSLVGFVETVVAPGSTVRTDGWQGYAPLKQRGYEHRPTTQGTPKAAAVLFPRVHRVFTHLKTWVWSTHRGVSRKHLPHYLNEFVFHFNRRRTPMGRSSRFWGSAVSTALRPTMPWMTLSQPG